MKNSQSISISTAAMSAGASLSAIAVCISSSDPHPTVALTIVGVACLLSSVAMIFISISNRSAEEKFHDRQNSTNSWFNDWIREHDHDQAMINVSHERKMESIEASNNRKIENIEASMNRIEERLNNLTIAFERAVVSSAENR